MRIDRFCFNMFSVNTYVIWDEKSREAFVVDPGMINKTEELVLDNFISENNLTVKGIIITHFHIDHTFGCDYVKLTYNVPVFGHKSDKILAGKRAEQARLFGLSENIGAIEINQELDEGDEINVGTEKISILHIPGHSPGSIVIYAKESSFIISGDVLFKHSIGRTDLIQGNYSQLINGIIAKLCKLPLDTIVYPGHGPETTIGEEIKFNPYI